jgi:hypothetical protein
MWSQQSLGPWLSTDYELGPCKMLPMHQLTHICLQIRKPREKEEEVIWPVSVEESAHQVPSQQKSLSRLHLPAAGAGNGLSFQEAKAPSLGEGVGQKVGAAGQHCALKLITGMPTCFHLLPGLLGQADRSQARCLLLLFNEYIACLGKDSPSCICCCPSITLFLVFLSGWGWWGGGCLPVWPQGITCSIWVWLGSAFESAIWPLILRLPSYSMGLRLCHLEACFENKMRQQVGMPHAWLSSLQDRCEHG